MFVTSLILLAAETSSAQPVSSLSLICSGASAKDQNVGTALSLLAGEGRVERVAIQDSAGFRLNADNTGQGRVPKRIRPAYTEGGKDGWFPLLSVRRTEEEITGQIRFHGMYKPRFRLDRLSGVVTISGNLGDFSGTCTPYDPATVERKF